MFKKFDQEKIKIIKAKEENQCYFYVVCVCD